MSAQATKVTLPMWARVLAIVVGIASIVLAFVVLAYPGLAVLTLVFLLALAFLFIGIDRLIAGVTGHPFHLLMPLAAPREPPSPPK
jgi:uncharacterized membrane protein HdeD (DUF308 family)